MNRLIALFTKLLIVILCTTVASCSDDDTQADMPKHIGTYSFDGKVDGIYSGAYAVGDIYYQFVFSPSYSLEEHNDMLITLMVSRSFDGVELDLEWAYHNDDYIFSYEDTLHFYSQYNALKSGKLLVKSIGEGEFLVEMRDVILPDGKEFSLHFEGKLQQAF